MGKILLYGIALAAACSILCSVAASAQNVSAEKPVGVVTDVQGTDNNDHVHCGGGPCSPDGKWRASVRNLKVVAPPGFYLQNARLSCGGGAGCDFTQRNGPFLQGDGFAATAMATSWSLPVTWTLQADVYKR